MNQKFAILIDGGFVTKVLPKRLELRSHITKTEIVTECNRIKNDSRLVAHDLLRIYYYDAFSYAGVAVNPIDGTKTDFSRSAVYMQNSKLLDQLELESDFAVRLGETVNHGWRIGSASMQSLVKSPRSLTATDLVPNIQQKGVDLRIGMDIALLSLRRLVDAIVVVAGDSDLVPALKFARREGVRVYLDHLGAPVRRETRAHADVVL